MEISWNRQVAMDLKISSGEAKTSAWTSRSPAKMSTSWTTRSPPVKSGKANTVEITWNRHHVAVDLKISSGAAKTSAWTSRSPIPWKLCEIDVQASCEIAVQASLCTEISLSTVGTFITKRCHFSVALNIHIIWWLVNLVVIKSSYMRLSAHFSVCWEAHKSHFSDFWLYFWTIFLHNWIPCKIKWYLHSKPSKNVKKKEKKILTPGPHL